MGVAEPWERRCGSCDGAGRIVAQAWLSWHAEYERLERIPDVVERLRALTGHVRRLPPVPESDTCAECGGEGVIVTQEGAALLDFLDRRFGIRPRPASPGSRPVRPHRLEPPRVPPPPPERLGNQDLSSTAASSVSPIPADHTPADEPEPPMGGRSFLPGLAGVPNVPPVPSDESTPPAAPPSGRPRVPASPVPPAPPPHGRADPRAARPPWRSDDTGH